MANWSDSIWNFFLNYHDACGCQTWQGGDLPMGAPTHKITRPFDHVVLQYYVQIKFIITPLPEWLWQPILAGW